MRRKSERRVTGRCRRAENVQELHVENREYLQKKRMLYHASRVSTAPITRRPWTFLAFQLRIKKEKAGMLRLGSTPGGFATKHAPRTRARNAN